MSKREPLRGYRRRVVEAEPDDEDGEEEGNNDTQATGSSLQRPNEKGLDDQYTEALKESGIDMEGMGEEEKLELAKILLLSKSEAEEYNKISAESSKAESPSSQPAESDAPAMSDIPAYSDALAVAEMPAMSDTDTPVVSDIPTEPEPPQLKIISVTSGKDVPDSPPGGAGVFLNCPHPDPELSTTSDALLDLEAFEEEYDGSSQSSEPLNGSMSQIFSLVDEDETQPPSQDLFSKTPESEPDSDSGEKGQGHKSPESGQGHDSQESSKGHLSEESGQGGILADKERKPHEPMDFSDCPTLAEDMVDGDLPVPSGNHRGIEDTQPMDVVFEKGSDSKGSAVLEVSLERVVIPESQSPSVERASPVEDNKPPDGTGRKRKAAVVVNPEPKQSRLEVEDQEEPSGFSMGTYLLDHDKAQPVTGKPLKRHYRKRRGVLKEKKYFCPSNSSTECDRYSDVIFQLFEAYRTDLREAQVGRLHHIPWGEPVRVGRHMSKTIDIKRRGRDSFYFEKIESDDEELGDIDKNTKGKELGSSQEAGSSTTQRSSRRRSCDSRAVEGGESVFDPNYNPVSDCDSDDFVSLPKTSRGRKRKSPGPSPEADELFEEEWLNSSRGGKSRNKGPSLRPRQVGTGRQTRSKTVQKPQLDFLEENDLSDQVTQVRAGNKAKSRLPTLRGRGKTYSKKAKLQTPIVRSESPVFPGDEESPLSDDEHVISDTDEVRIDEPSTEVQKTSPLFKKSSEKLSVRKTFTFKSKPSGKVEVSTEIDLISDDEETSSQTPKKNEQSSRLIDHIPEAMSLKIPPSLSRNLTRRLSGLSKTNTHEDPQCSDSQSKGDNLCSMEEFPDTLVESGDIVLESRGKRLAQNKASSAPGGSRDGEGGEVFQSGKKREIDVEHEGITQRPRRKASPRCLKINDSDKSDSESESDEDSGDTRLPKLIHKRAGPGIPVVDPDFTESDEANFNLLSAAVFSRRGKRRSASSLFSKNDESFNLGVSPEKAFPGIFESSGSSPLNSGQATVTESPKFGVGRSIVYTKPTKAEVTKPNFDSVNPNSSVYNASTEEDSPNAKGRPKLHVEKKQQEVGVVRPVDRLRSRSASREEDGEGGRKAAADSSGNGRDDSPVVELVVKHGNVVEETTHTEDKPASSAEGMACPLCAVVFSMEEIEEHASGCGTVQDEPEVVRPEEWGFAQHGQEADGEEDECYICDRAFPRGEEYQKHVDECLEEARRQQEQLEKGSKVKRGRGTRSRPVTDSPDEDLNIVEVGHHSNREGIRKRRKVENQRGVISEEVTEFDPRFSTSESESESESGDEGEQKEPGAAPKPAPGSDVEIDFSRISDSPIKTFRKIDQLDGCLINFSNQFKKSDNVKRKPVANKTRKRKSGRRKKAASGRRKTAKKK